MRVRGNIVIAGSQRAAEVKRQSLLWQDVAAVAMLVLLSLILFRSQIFGDGLYIGNPDRLNSNLKILKFHLIVWRAVTSTRGISMKCWDTTRSFSPTRFPAFSL